MTYGDYLHMETLLSLQEPKAPNTAGRAVVLAEQFFIITHQSCELWLKQLGADLDAAAEALLPPCDPHDLELGLEFLQRSGELIRVLQQQLAVLEKLPLRYFAEFRTYLDTASGAQSAQFRRLTVLLGNSHHQGSLYEAFAAAAEYHGQSVPDVLRRGVECGVLHRLAEALVDLGNGYWHWKVAHLALVSKMIGEQDGTGGSSGVDFLARRVTRPFPELRRLRGKVHHS
ncbi:tryptophan 2,3-dioxygenase family protein [Streptomyces lancefieldiae]|uniref:Tryptophan 2,3-dioxygenase family protein n=1 Tax=Streptomyces lancefieldiae TaxID=3075520 RepID=A0ABU3AQX6_9ACTN|nr:tryptophan 2,3-dioxygenase family protein [Streptomyces sp. DSM 40712]MDT0611488.1 tryptophan 2,3-dioxygenase family protein [Streptomyces sp. DSM 40712]